MAERTTPENSGTVPKPKRKPPRGRPFPKGVSGNPGGRPKEAKELREALALQGDALIKKLLAQAEEGNTMALLRALEYVLGKPSQDLHLSGPGGDPLEVVVRVVSEGDE